MKIAAAVLVAGVMLTACGHRKQSKLDSPDMQLRRALAGTWLRKNDGMMTLGLDGSFSSEMTNSNAKPAKAWKYDGNWAITNGACFMTCTSVSTWNTTNSEAVGSTDSCKIIRVNESKLVWENGGETIYWTRANESEGAK